MRNVVVAACCVVFCAVMLWLMLDLDTSNKPPYRIDNVTKVYNVGVSRAYSESYRVLYSVATLDPVTKEIGYRQLRYDCVVTIVADVPPGAPMWVDVDPRANKAWCHVRGADDVVVAPKR
jgi:hypothetical protein